jgi:hypothetical protein
LHLLCTKTAEVGVSMMKSTEKAVFKDAAFYFDVIREITPAILRHEYKFMRDDVFDRLVKSDEVTPSMLNQILSLELIDKAHLAATSALLRTKRWADAVCLMYEAENFLGWASSARGLLESSGDIVDGLLDIPYSLAEHHRQIAQGLSGSASQDLHGYSQFENKLDHFVFAKWMRAKKGEENILKAKDNAAYIELIERVMPNAKSYYQRLCGITHPSNASLEFLVDDNTSTGGPLRLSASNDRQAITAMCAEFPTALSVTLEMSCNPALLILRVLHKFGVHPKLAFFKKMHWANIKMWPDIERFLKS